MPAQTMPWGAGWPLGAHKSASWGRQEKEEIRGSEQSNTNCRHHTLQLKPHVIAQVSVASPGAE